MFNNTILGRSSRFRQRADAYLKAHHLPLDDRGEGHDYDLVVTTSDRIIQRNIRQKPIVLIQEGMTDPENLTYHLIKPQKVLSTLTT